MSKRTDRLLKENNEQEKRLNAENHRVLTDIVVYLRASNISPWRQELVRRDIRQMLADGEARGEDAAAVIGNDYKAFCDSVLAEIPPMSRGERLLGLVRDLLLGTAALAGVRLFSGALSSALDGGWPRLTVTAGDLASAALILAGASALFAVIGRGAFGGRAADRRLFALFFGFWLACACLSFFLRRPLLHVHVLAAAAVPLMLLAAYRLLDRKLD